VVAVGAQMDQGGWVQVQALHAYRPDLQGEACIPFITNKQDRGLDRSVRSAEHTASPSCGILRLRTMKSRLTASDDSVIGMIPLSDRCCSTVGHFMVINDPAPDPVLGAILWSKRSVKAAPPGEEFVLGFPIGCSTSCWAERHRSRRIHCVDRPLDSKH
jgi:hypothetical protein